MRNMMGNMTRTTRRPTSPWGLVFTGFAAIAAGVYMYTQQQSFMEKAQETTGIVQEVVRTYETRHRDGVSRQEEVYRSVVAFTVDGRSYTFRESGRMREGEQVTVLYDPENPENAQIKSKMTQFIWPALGGGGLISIIAGIVMIKKRKQAGV